MSKLHPVIKDGQGQSIDGDGLFECLMIMAFIVVFGLIIYGIVNHIQNVPVAAALLFIVGAAGFFGLGYVLRGGKP